MQALSIAVMYSPRLRLLGIETSSARGSVALLENERVCVAAGYEQQGAHDTSLQPLIERALEEAGWTARDLARVAVGVGPGSFTGLRVGIALASGISEGLQVPLVGVSSLAAMAAAAPRADRTYVPLIDARRGELFIAAYSADGLELMPPRIAAGIDEVERLVSALPGSALLLGRAWDPLASKLAHHASEDTDLPHARWTALLGARAQPGAPVRPEYLRPAVAAPPQLERNPLSAEASASGDSAGALGGQRPER